MKYKLIGITSFVFLLAAAFVISFFAAEDAASGRVHQHILSGAKEQCSDHTENEFCSHLPLVAIETGGKPIPGDITDETDRFNESAYTLTSDGEAMETVSIRVFDSKKTNNHLTDTPSLETLTLIRKRGHLSRSFEKAQYALKLISSDGLENKQPLMGMDIHDEWILNGPYLDKSLLRNYLFYNISGEIMSYAPNVRYCEVFLDGVYQGVYLMAESVTSGNGSRLDLTVTQKGNKLTGYLLKIDRPVEQELELTREIYTMSERQNYTAGNVIIKYPGKASLSEETAAEIELDISRFDKVMYSYDYNSPKYGYKNYIDTDSFAEYFIINEFSKNLDAGVYSSYIYKKPGDKYKMCVWDFNNSCDNYPDDWVGHKGFSLNDKLYFVALCRDKDFTEAVIKKYRELRKTFLNEEYLLNYIDETAEFLGEAMSRNEERWAAYIKSDTHPQELRENPHSHKEAIEQLKSWIINRGNWLDENIDTLRQYSAPSKVKKYNEVTE